jgi:hypothetical protein
MIHPHARTDRVATRNRYVVCTGEGAAPIDWALDDPDPVRIDCHYFGRVLQAMEEHLDEDGLTVYLTWDLDRLPSYGDDVVAVVLGDEDSRLPRYLDRVRVVFKSYGTRPHRPQWCKGRGAWLNVLLTLDWAARSVRHLPDDVRLLALRLSRRPLAPIVDIPAGYFNQRDLPLVPFEQRTTPIYFSGNAGSSVSSRWSPRFWLRSPRQFSRRELIRAMETVERVADSETVDYHVTPDNWDPDHRLTDDYSHQLMDARIAPVPRGNVAETCRLFEAARYGCVIIAEDLPDRWFYEGAPFLRIDRWHQLPRLVDELLADEDTLARLHDETLTWWRDRCSEHALGVVMAQAIDSAPRRPEELPIGAAHPRSYRAPAPCDPTPAA